MEKENAPVCTECNTNQDVGKISFPEVIWYCFHCHIEFFDDALCAGGIPEKDHTGYNKDPNTGW